MKMSVPGGMVYSSNWSSSRALGVTIKAGKQQQHSSSSTAAAAAAAGTDEGQLSAWDGVLVKLVLLKSPVRVGGTKKAGKQQQPADSGLQVKLLAHNEHVDSLGSDTSTDTLVCEQHAAA
jgi:hypothetical protein